MKLKRTAVEVERQGPLRYVVVERYSNILLDRWERCAHFTQRGAEKCARNLIRPKAGPRVVFHIDTEEQP